VVIRKDAKIINKIHIMEFVITIHKVISGIGNTAQILLQGEWYIYTPLL